MEIPGISPHAYGREVAKKTPKYWLEPIDRCDGRVVIKKKEADPSLIVAVGETAPDLFVIERISPSLENSPLQPGVIVAAFPVYSQIYVVSDMVTGDDVRGVTNAENILAIVHQYVVQERTVPIKPNERADA